MKNKKAIYFLLVLILIFIITKINFAPNFADIEVDNKFYNNYFPKTANPKIYKSLSFYENEKKLTFPRTYPKKVILYSNYSFLKSKQELSKDEVETLFKILNDSTKYLWGELGTPEVHYYFKFFDERNNLIGVTKIDQEGMAYSEPYLAKMKWCGIKKIEEINNLIQKIEN